MSPYDLRMVTKAIAAAVDDGPRGTKARLARLLDVEPATVTKWVQGQIVPERHRWPAIEAALGMSKGELERSANETRSFELSDDAHEVFLRALRQDLVGNLDELTWDSVMALIGTAAWLFHLERLSVRHGIADPGFGGLEDFLAEWERLGDLKELNDLARSRVERHLSALASTDPAAGTGGALVELQRLVAADLGQTEPSTVEKAVRKGRTKPRPRAEDEP